MESVVCSHATQVGGPSLRTKTIHTIPLYPTEGNYSRESQVRSAQYSGTEDPPGISRYFWFQSVRWFCCGTLPVHYQHYDIQRIYASGVFVTHTMIHLDTAERAYVVWDTYITSSIMESVREKRDKLKELARFPAWLAWTVYLPLREDCIHCLARWQAGLQYIWHQSGRHRTQPLHTAICHSLGKEKSAARSMFHGYTGCDTISAFCGKGNKSVWEAWSSYQRSLRPSTTWQQIGTLPWQ